MNRDRLILGLIGGRPAERVRVLERARRAGYRSFLVAGEPIGQRPGESWFRLRAGAIVPGAPAVPIPLVTVGSPKALQGALARASRTGGVAIRWKGPRIIPLEGALAGRPAGTAIWVVTDQPQEVPAALGALEVGADRVVLEVRDPSMVEELERGLEPSVPGPLRWGTARVVRIESIGVSDRVLVDTTALLTPDEGLLVGSSAALLFHVASEALGSAFSKPRPFRVNAGSPHSYVLMADGTTRYLAELEPGERLFVTKAGGPGRSVSLGRAKIERRPMLLIGARAGARMATVFVQEAETVRVTTATGATPVTDLAVGRRLRVASLPPARHLGVSVDERIEER